MKPNALFIILLLISLSTVSVAQNKVKGSVYTDSADLKILNIYPDSFPRVSVIFKAETRSGNPVWNLTTAKMRVKENEQDCKVISLQLVSKNKPVNLGIVIDHSGSMMDDSTEIRLNHITSLPLNENGIPLYPKNYLSPLYHAKEAIKKFISGFDSQKDLISVTGFSSTVSEKLSLTNNITRVTALVDSLSADGSTALYDGMASSLDEIKDAYGLKIMIVLTDGQDNSSKENIDALIDRSKKENIPVYIIGLGNVNKTILEKIAGETNGKFYYTKSSSTFDSIYQSIRKQIQAFYDLVYESPDFSKKDTTRNIELSFAIDSIYLTSTPSSINLPAEVINYLEKKEKQKEYLVIGIIALITLVAAGMLLLNYRKKRMNQPLNIISLFPNPTTGNINMSFSGNVKELEITNMNGNIVKKYLVSRAMINLDLSGLRSGTYIIVAKNDAQQSEPAKLILQH